MHTMKKLICRILGHKWLWLEGMYVGEFDGQWCERCGLYHPDGKWIVDGGKITKENMQSLYEAIAKHHPRCKQYAKTPGQCTCNKLT